MPAAQDPCAWYFGFLIAVHPLILAALPAAIEPLVFLAYPLQPVRLFLPLEEYSQAVSFSHQCFHDCYRQIPSNHRQNSQDGEFCSLAGIIVN